MFSLIQKKKLNNYVLHVGNYKISQKKSSYDVLSGTGVSFGGLPIYILHLTLFTFSCDLSNYNLLQLVENKS